MVQIQESTVPTFHLPVALVANGPMGDEKTLAQRLSTYNTVIAVDGGLRTCHQLGISPHLIIGDMDSADPGLLDCYPNVSKKTFSIDKDYTDLELAVLEVKKQKIDSATLFCALKGRTDHSLYNLYLLGRYKEMLTIETDDEILFLVEGSRTISCTPGQTISLLPLNTPAKGVSTRGLKWDLERATLDETFMSVSNICLQETFTLYIEEGELLCFLVLCKETHLMSQHV